MKLRSMTNATANLCLLLISSVVGLCLSEFCLRLFYQKYRYLSEPGLGQGAARIIDKLHIPYLILDVRGRLPLGEEVATDEKLGRERRSRVRAEGGPSNEDWKNNDGRGTGPAMPPSRLRIRPDFNVSIDGKRLIYNKAVCPPVDRQSTFFLHVTPVDENDLPESRAEYGFVNLDFDPTGFQIDERGCTVEYQLPDYAIRHIRTGQYTPGEDPIWEGEFFIQRRAGATEGRLQWVEGEEMRYQVFIDPADIVSYGVEN